MSEKKKTLDIGGLIRSIVVIIKFIKRIIKFSDLNIYNGISGLTSVRKPI